MDGPTDTSTHDLSTLQTQNIHLLAQLDDALSLQRSAMAEVLKLEKERWERKEEDLRKEKVKKRRRLRRMKLEEERRRREMGEVVGNGAKDDRDDIGEGEGVSSSTGEISESASE